MCIDLIDTLRVQVGWAGVRKLARDSGALVAASMKPWDMSLERIMPL